MSGDDLSHTPLGKQSSASLHYDPAQLCAIPRVKTWENRGFECVPWHGVDIWNAWEISWLNAGGLPQVALGEFRIPAVSPNIIESKSLKLYLNSFNETVFENYEAVAATIKTDLSQCAGEEVMIVLGKVDEALNTQLALTGECLDRLSVEIQEYNCNPKLLKTEDTRVENQKRFSHLLKSNCPVTGQPDWGSVWIEYSGNTIVDESLLKYIVSYRRQSDFHEQCVENMFLDILTECQPDSLTVYARYLRRGGLDINPWRSTENTPVANERLLRQ